MDRRDGNAWLTIDFKMSKDGKIESVQMLRGIACVIVVLFHAHQILSGPKTFNGPIMWGFWEWGSRGVDLFFVISGFIMAYVHYDDFTEGRGATRFLRSRISRIYTPYWPILTLLVMVYFLIPTLGVDSGRDPRDIWIILKSVILYPNTQGIMSVAWTLQHEVVFYGIVLLLLTNRVFGVLVFTVWQLASLFFALLPTAASNSMGFPLSAFEVQFVFGIACMMITRKVPAVAFPHLLMGLGASAFFLLGMYETFVLKEVLQGYARTLPYGVASSGIILGAIYLERANKMKTPSFLYLFGAASYSIYLLHYEFIVLAGKVVKTMCLNFPSIASAALLIVSGFAVLAGIGYHFCVEVPLTRKVKSYLGSIIG